MKNLAPEIFRQRLVIEGRCPQLINSGQIKEYLRKLSFELKMRILMEPVTHKSPKFGWAGWVHWETSGCHFYAWDKPFPFFSSDIYTCKAFDEKTAVKFTKKFFKVKEIAFKSV